MEIYTQGCHAAVFLLGTGALTNGWGRGCLQAYQERFCGCRCGLANSHLAVVADSLHPALSTVQVGVWSPLRKCVFRTHRYARRRGRGRGRGRVTEDKTPRILKPPPPKPFDVHYDYTPLEDLKTAFDTSTQSSSGQASSDPNKLWDVMASQLHALLDVPPWRPGEHAIIDVHWLVGEDPVPSPRLLAPCVPYSTALALSGALLRLKMWHKMHLEIVTSREPGDTSRETGDESSKSQEWFEMVEGRLCSVDTWNDGLGTIWRGDLHFTERRSTLKQACRRTVVFPGFSLTILHTDTTSVSPSSSRDDAMSCPALLREVGLPENWCTHPTHLEVIHILDMSTLPLFWLSPIHCSLSLVNGAHGDSKLLLRRLFQGKTGLLVRLCFADEARSPVQHKTTADWTKHIQSVDESEICTRASPSPLMAYETGPVLAVYQSDTREMSCDAWFLWKPEAINNTPFPDLQTTRPRVASKDQTTRPPEASEDQTTRPRAASEDQTTRPPEASKDKTTPPEAASKDQTTRPPEASEDQTTPPEVSKDQTTPPEAVSKDQTTRPHAASSDQQVSLTLPVITDDQQVIKDGKSGGLTSSRLQEEFRQAEATFKRDMDLPFSEWPEIQALSTYEWIQRKLVHRIKTPDLMFGQLVAPPPSSATTSCVSADDMLKCFHDTGSPATSELSPITNDISDVVRIHNPGDTVPSFESISAGTPGSKKHYHGINYCLQPEDSMMDARLTRIQQRYLLSERASNCSSSNTPEVKLEQRRRRRLRKVETSAGSTERGGRDSGGAGGVRTDTEQERLKLTAQQSRGGRGGEKGKVMPRADSKGKKRMEMVTSTTTTEPTICSTSSEHSDPKLNRSPVLMLHRVNVKEDSEAAVAESQQTTPTRSSVGIKLNRSPVVKLHRILTPPSNQPVSLLNQLTSRQTAEITVEQPLESSHHLDPRTTTSEKQRLELTRSDTTQPSGGAGPLVSSSQSSSAETTLRRSPRRNKWIVGQPGGGSVPPDGDSKEASGKGKSNKKKLEQIIVVALKKNGMQRDHICFRKCYNRLFNLSKSFLKDLRNSKALVSEMHRVVEFNVSQVIDFELRQVHSSQ